MSKKVTTEDFIARSQKVHGDLYDYSKSKYIDSETRICIIDPIHGEFWQLPFGHMAGSGCPQRWDFGKRSAVKLSSLEEFIPKAIAIHGDKYDYSKFHYINARTKGIIICPEHGEFLQTPNNHLNGNDCKLCTLRFIPTVEGFIQKAKEVHGNKYDYSKSEYITTHTKTIIICPKHGEFNQTPSNHANGQGCMVCGGRQKLTTEDFILRSSILHNNFYNYRNVNYTNCDAKVEIICPHHGPFQQRAMSHLRGAGCRKCLFGRLSNINISQLQIDYLNHLNISNVNFRIGKYLVDGIKDNVVYEFLGDYWHSNPKEFDHEKLHPHYKISHKQVYENTFKRFKEIHDMGYQIKYTWEKDWNKYKQGKQDLKIINFNPLSAPL